MSPTQSKHGEADPDANANRPWLVVFFACQWTRLLQHFYQHFTGCFQYFTKTKRQKTGAGEKGSVSQRLFGCCNGEWSSVLKIAPLGLEPIRL